MKYKLIPLEPQPVVYKEIGMWCWKPVGHKISIGKIEAILLFAPKNTLKIVKNNKGVYCWKIKLC